MPWKETLAWLLAFVALIAIMAWLGVEQGHALDMLIVFLATR